MNVPAPLVSVVIPTFNRKKKVPTAVRSVLEQTFTDRELIVVDDCSTDGTADCLQQEFGNQLVLLSQQNLGVSAARNLGAKFSNGEFIAFLDSDDFWHKDKLKRQMVFHQQNQTLKISQTQEIWIRRGQRVNWKKKHQKKAGYIFPECLQLCVITPSSVLLTSELFREFGGFDENMCVCEDYDFWLRIAAKNKVGLVDEQLVTKFGGHEDQLSRKYLAIDRYRIYALFKILLTGKLTNAQQKQVTAVSNKKMKILISGARKRRQATNNLESLGRDVFNQKISLEQFLKRGKEILLNDELYL